MPALRRVYAFYYLFCYYSISMKKVKDEEEYFLSGWEDRGENEEYGSQGLTRQLP